MLHSPPDVRLTIRRPTVLVWDLMYLSVIWMKNEVTMLADNSSLWGLRVPSP